jgi:hypothetical protein
MRRRPPRTIALLPDEITLLEEIVRDGHVPQRVAQRARILLTMTAPEAVVEELGERFGADRTTIWRLCRRYEDEGLAALFDAPRSGRPRALSPPGSRPDRAPRVL